MPRTPRPVFFLSDFGTADAYVGIVEAVVLGIAPAVRVVHLTHGVPPQDLRNGAWQLWSALPFLPDGAVVLAVVDPGVGSERPAVVVETARHRLVAPDNGLLGPALSREEIRSVHLLEAASFRRSEVSATFHGRDIFGPAAAHLALGLAPDALGPALAAAHLVSAPLRPAAASRGEVWTSDHFGNLITTLLCPDPPPAGVTLAGVAIAFRRTYAEASAGELLALRGSSGLVEISVRDGSALRRLGVRAGASVGLLGVQRSG